MSWGSMESNVQVLDYKPLAPVYNRYYDYQTWTFRILQL